MNVNKDGTMSTNINEANLRRPTHGNSNPFSLIGSDKKITSTEFVRNSLSVTDNDELLDQYHHLRRSWGIYKRNEMDMFNSFYRYKRVDPYHMFPTTFEYVFFTRPCLHFFGGEWEDKKGNKISDIDPYPPTFADPLLADMYKRGYDNILRELQYGQKPQDGDEKRPFMNILTNRISSSIDLPSIQAEDVESNANYMGTKIRYRRGTEKSDEETEFTTEFEDTRNMDIYYLFRAWDEYEKMKWYGKIPPPNQNYTLFKVLHDQIGIFRFIVAEDGCTILHWTQWWGAYPVTVPRESFSDIPQDGHLKITVQWRAAFVEDLNPLTLTHFNALSNQWIELGSVREVPIWDDDYKVVSGEEVIKPFIGREDDKDNSNYRYSGLEGANKKLMYQLKWYARK